MSDDSYTFFAADEGDTERLGRALAGLLPEGGVVALAGPLGAGKTRLVQAVASACGVERQDVVSPTFVLVHEYQGRRPVIHIDAYRVRDDDEFLELGAEEYFGPPNLVLVEWADRVARCLPDERLEVTISPLSQESRRFDVAGRGSRYRQIVGRLRRDGASTG